MSKLDFTSGDEKKLVQQIFMLPRSSLSTTKNLILICRLKTPFEQTPSINHFTASK